MKTHVSWTGAAVLLTLAAFASVAAAAPPASRSSLKVDEVVRRLQQRYDATTDFTAEFTQTVDVASLGRTLTSKGRVYFKRPGRMRWEFREPEVQTIVVDGRTLWVYQPDHQQVMKTAFQAAFQSATPVTFLLGVGKLAADFRASLVSVGAETLSVRLEPKQDAEIGILVLTVDRKSYDLVAAEITDPLGNVTRLAFSGLKRGVGLDDSHFTFEPPPGVDVVEAPEF